MMCKVYTDVGGIKQLYHVCPPVRKIIHSLKLADYLHVQADKHGITITKPSVLVIGLHRQTVQKQYAASDQVLYCLLRSCTVKIWIKYQQLIHLKWICPINKGRKFQ